MTMTSTDIASKLDSEHLEVFSSMPVRVLDPTDVAGAVSALRESAAARRAGLPPAPVPSGVTTEDRAVPGPEGAPDIMVRLYRPATLPNPAPTLLWVHGGGMVMGSVEMNDALLWEACRATQRRNRLRRIPAGPGASVPRPPARLLRGPELARRVGRRAWRGPQPHRHRRSQLGGRGGRRSRPARP